MKGRRFSRLLLLATAVAMPVESAYAASSVRCESRNGRYEYCRIPTGGRARVDRRLSDASCSLGRSWGYDRNGVWVRDGCRAVFEVAGYRNSGGQYSGGPYSGAQGRPGYGGAYGPGYGGPGYGNQGYGNSSYYYPDDDRDRDRDDDDRLSNGEVAIVALGALVGGAVLGSLANQSSSAPAPQPIPQRAPVVPPPPVYESRQPEAPPAPPVAPPAPSEQQGAGAFAVDHDYERGRVPSWLVGQFRGQSAVYRKEIQLTVYSDGTAYIGPAKASVAPSKGGAVGTTKDRDEGVYKDGQIQISGRQYTVTQDGTGVVLQEVGDTKNELRFTRVY